MKMGTPTNDNRVHPYDHEQWLKGIQELSPEELGRLGQDFYRKGKRSAVVGVRDLIAAGVDIPE